LFGIAEPCRWWVVIMAKIILFGSYAYGTPEKDSDLDIMVVTSDESMPRNFSEKSKLYLRVSKLISDIKKQLPIDLIVHTKAMHDEFNSLNSMFAREIRERGRILYEKGN